MRCALLLASTKRSRSRSYTRMASGACSTRMRKRCSLSRASLSARRRRRRCSSKALSKPAITIKTPPTSSTARRCSCHSCGGRLRNSVCGGRRLMSASQRCSCSQSYMGTGRAGGSKVPGAAGALPSSTASDICATCCAACSMCRMEPPRMPLPTVALYMPKVGTFARRASCTENGTGVAMAPATSRLTVPATSTLSAGRRATAARICARVRSSR